MPYITNWLKTLLFIFFLLIIVTITFAYLLIRQSIPEYNKHYSLSEPFGTIEIIRDTNAIPHIFADDNRDVFLHWDLRMHKIGCGKCFLVDGWHMVNCQRCLAKKL